MMSQHSNSLATATADNLAHNEKSIETVHQNGRRFHGKRMHANALLEMTIEMSLTVNFEHMLASLG